MVVFVMFRVVTLLQKRIPEAQFTADFIGFSIPNVFVVGYGLDYNEEFRDMRHLCVLNQVPYHPVSTEFFVF